MALSDLNVNAVTVERNGKRRSICIESHSKKTKVISNLKRHFDLYRVNHKFNRLKAPGFGYSHGLDIRTAQSRVHNFNPDWNGDILAPEVEDADDEDEKL